MKKFNFSILKFILFLLIFYSNNAAAQNKTIKVENFDKVIISQHIRVILTEGETESVYIENEGVDESKIKVELIGTTLRIYMDQARLYTKYYKTNENGHKRKTPVYKGTLVTAHITYKNIKKLSIRGEETITCESSLIADNFKLKIYGESTVILTSVESSKMKISMFGENDLEILNGNTYRQKINSYGENKIEAPDFNSRFTKINTFGECRFNLNVWDNIRVSAFGESEISYKGDAHVNKVIVIGENKISPNRL